MSDSINSLTFTWADIDQWFEQGLIAPDQAIAIRQQVEQVGSPVPALQARISQKRREERPGLNLVTIAYYFGSFMILLAYTFFMGLHWQSMSYLLQFAASALTAGILWSVGVVLRRYGSPLAGGLV